MLKGECSDCKLRDLRFEERQCPQASEMTISILSPQKATGNFVRTARVRATWGMNDTWFSEEAQGTGICCSPTECAIAWTKTLYLASQSAAVLDLLTPSPLPPSPPISSLPSLEVTVYSMAFRPHRQRSFFIQWTEISEETHNWLKGGE